MPSSSAAFFRRPPWRSRALRMSSALTSWMETGSALSADEGYLNRPLLLEGAWPSGKAECVVGAAAAEELGISERTLYRKIKELDIR